MLKELQDVGAPAAALVIVDAPPVFNSHGVPIDFAPGKPEVLAQKRNQVMIRRGNNQAMAPCAFGCCCIARPELKTHNWPVSAADRRVQNDVLGRQAVEVTEDNPRVQ